MAIRTTEIAIFHEITAAQADVGVLTRGTGMLKVGAFESASAELPPRTAGP